MLTIIFDQVFLTQIGQTLVLMLINILYATVSIGIGIAAMRIAYKIFDSITSFDTEKIIEQSPLGVANTVAAIILGAGICSGLIIGMATN